MIFNYKPWIFFTSYHYKAYENRNMSYRFSRNNRVYVVTLFFITVLLLESDRTVFWVTSNSSELCL